MRVILLLVALTQGVTAWSQNKTTFGSTNASRCYQESNSPFSDYGLTFCNDAIEDDAMMIRDLAATYTNRGIIYAANGKLEEAMADHSQAALLAPDMAKIFVNRGNVFHQIHEFERALEDYDTALQLANVKLDVVYYNISLALIRLKRWDDAREALEKALEINPNSGRVKRKLAQFDEPQEKPSAIVVNPDEADF